MFITHGKWNNAARSAAPAMTALSDTGPFGNRLEGTTFGIHLETWW
jgi:hypothetical protein